MAYDRSAPVHEKASIELPSEAEWGPLMRALPTDRQRLFVIAMLETGGLDASRAAALAGYTTNSANALYVVSHRLAHDAAILAAMAEQASRRLHSGGILAVSQLLTLAKSAEKDADKIKASVAILNRIGMHEKTEHKVTVTDNSKTDAQLLSRIAYLSKELGVDGQKLLGHVKLPVIDAEFSVVPPASEDPDDFL